MSKKKNLKEVARAFERGLEFGRRGAQAAAPAPAAPPPPPPPPPAAPPPPAPPPPKTYRQLHKELKETNPWLAADLVLRHGHELDAPAPPAGT